MNKSQSDRKKKAAPVALLTALAALISNAQTLTTLMTFGGAAGVQPMSITRGADGNFYGTTFGSPTVTTAQYGTIFKITPSGTFSTLYTFCPGGTPCSDGSYPSGLTQGSDGNFYGATTNYGASGGTIFKITPAGVFTTIYSFTTSDGSGGDVKGNLIQAADGNFYGESGTGGSNQNGAVFKITPTGVFTTIYTFPRTPPGGENPTGGLVQGSDGNFYGTTLYGGTGGNGIIFKLTPSGTITTLYNYPITSGSLSLGAMVQGTDGNFYGATSQGGNSNNGGTIFKITPSGTYTTLYSFLASPTGSDGGTPSANLVQGTDGNFYGSTEYGGNPNGYGTIFKITPTGTLTTLYAFSAKDGEYPLGVALGTDGNLYGVASQGGSTNYGTIFRLQLVASGPPYTCTNTTPPVITSVDSASAYGAYPYFASGSWLEIKGTNLADANDPRLAAATNPGQWTTADFNLSNAPTVLDGISVSINGKPAYVWYLSTAQLNVQAPEDAVTGNVAITVTNCNATSNPITFARRALAPGFLAPANYAAGGMQYMVATFQSDGGYVLNAATGASFGLNSRPAKPGDGIIAYGIGFGDVTPSTILPGQVVGASNALVNPVTLSFGTNKATLAYAGLAGGFVGLYEFYFNVPASLANGDYQINVTQNGTAIPQTMYLTVHN